MAKAYSTTTRDAGPKSGAAGKAMKQPKHAVAAGPAKAGGPGAAPKPDRAPAPGARTVPPDRPLLPDINTSAVGEEDPGAAMDLTSRGATTAPACPAAAQRERGTGPRRPR